MSFTEAAVSIIHVHHETSLAFYLLYIHFCFVLFCFLFIYYYCNDKHSDVFPCYSCTSYCMHLVIDMDKTNLIREEKTKQKQNQKMKKKKKRKGKEREEKKWFE